MLVLKPVASFETKNKKIIKQDYKLYKSFILKYFVVTT